MHAFEFSPDVSSARTVGDISPNSARYTKVKHVAHTSASHRRCPQLDRHEIVKTSPLRPSHNPDIRLLADVAQINPFNLPLGITDYPAILPRIFLKGSSICTSISAPIATRTRPFHRQYIAKHFAFMGPIASGPF